MQVMWLPEGASMIVAQPRGDDLIITPIGPDRPHWSALAQFANQVLPEGAWWIEVEALRAGGLRVSLMEPDAHSASGRRERSQLYITRDGCLPLGPTRIRKRDLAVLLAAIPPEY